MAIIKYSTVELDPVKDTEVPGWVKKAAEDAKKTAQTKKEAEETKVEEE